MSTSGHENEVVRVSGLKASLKKGGNKGLFNEAICSTAGGTPAKVTNTTPPSFSLTGGAKIIVKFTYGISVANATLQVGEADAKPIYYRGSALPAGVIKTGDRVLLGYNGSQFDVIGHLDTIYEAGTRALLNAGTDQTERTWQAKLLKEYIDDNTLHPLLLESLPQDYVFKVGDVLSFNGELYKCTSQTEDLPFDIVAITENGETKLVYEEINGERSYIADDMSTLNTGWEKIADCSQGFMMESKIDDGAKMGNGYAICATAGATAAKEVYIRNFQLKRNGRVSVLFTYGFTASNPTLNVSGTGAYPISFYNNATLLGKVRNNTILNMVFENNVWNVVSIEYLAFNPTPGAVDLGLPSGILWCDHNVGAESPEDDGLYFSWGNVEGHTGDDGYDFGINNSGTYASTPGAALTANIPVNDTYDAARKNMGAPWRMPTQAELAELNSNCTSIWTTQNGVAGIRFTSNINGNSIFIPAAGFRSGTGLTNHGSNGYCRSSSLSSPNNGYNLYFSSQSVNPEGNDARFYGFTIRPVQ